MPPSVASLAPARALAAALVASGFAAWSSAAVAEIYKCVDRKGHTTYQQSPCPDGQGGAPLELAEPLVTRPGALPSDQAEAMWHAAAREGRAVIGMPKPFVTQGLGAPTEIRPPRAGEVGSEVWVYPKSGQVTRIGFQDNAVAWMRTDAPERRAASGVAATAQAAAGDRERRVREALAIGKTCTAAIQDAGPPDREEPLAVGQGVGAGTRYVYVFDAANANAYAAFVCLNGRVTSVERYLPGQK